MLSWLKKKFASANVETEVVSTSQEASGAKLNALDLGIACRRHGNALLEQGKLEEAAASYEAALEHNREDVGAYINLAYVRKEQGRFDEAEKYLQDALVINPNEFDANFLLGSVAKVQARYDEAIQHLRSALRVQPHAVHVYMELCPLLVRCGRRDEAKDCLRQGIAVNESTAVQSQLLFFLGDLLLKERQFAEAEECFRKVLAAGSVFAELRLNLGLALEGLGKFDDASIEFQAALQLKDKYLEAMCSLARIDLLRQKFENALSKYELAHAWAPDSAEVLCGIANALTSLKRFQEAIVQYDRALQLDGKHVQALNNRGIALGHLKLFDAALASFEQALQLQPDFADAAFNCGNAWSELQENEKAIACYRRVIELDPDKAAAYSNIAVVCVRENRYDEALSHFARAIQRDSSWADAHYGEALCRLVLGDFETGWQKHEWRWQTEQFADVRNQYPQSVWLGQQSIEGKTILLYDEQGLGDSIQFLRYVNLVADMGAKVLLRVQPELNKLLSENGGDYVLVKKGEALPPFDFQCPLMSLPLAFRTTLETIPAMPAYLRSNPERREIWDANLGSRTKPRIGLVWSGNTSHSNDKNRSISLEKLSRIFTPDAHFVSLQKELRESDQKQIAAGIEITHFGNRLTDFTDTAALIDNLDLVISVDTSVAHLAGALGKPVWVLLPFRPDWRWMLNRNDSPWYPSMRLFRQNKIGDWDNVLEELVRELKLITHH